MITFKNIDQNLYDPEGLKTDFRKTAKGKSGKEQVRKVKRNPEKIRKGTGTTASDEYIHEGDAPDGNDQRIFM